MNGSVGQCLYFSCEFEVGLIFLAMAVVALALCSIPHYYRLHQCKKGTHALVHWHSTGSYGGWWECECRKKVKFIHIG